MKIDTAFLFLAIFICAFFSAGGDKYEDLFVKSLAYGWVLLCLLNALYRVLRNFYYKFFRAWLNRSAGKDK